jgi:hypothetical protein
MDFVTVLRRDHEKLSSIFNQIQRGFDQPDTPERHELFRQLKRELELHAAVEDLQVYRVFQQAESTHDDAHEVLEADGEATEGIFGFTGNVSVTKSALRKNVCSACS